MNLNAQGLSQGGSNMDNPFGVLEFLHWDHCWNSYKYGDKKDLQKAVDLMKEAGIGWVRLDFLWEDIEPAQGKFEFQKYDYIVELLKENNINILGILNYSAAWASSDGEWNSPPKDNKLFVNYATEVASRYNEKIKFWEIWNEPDSRVYWAKQDGLKSYCALLKEVYLALKKVNPKCKVLNGGLATGVASINKLYDNGAKDYFDILNIHIFEDPHQPSAIKNVVSYVKVAEKIMARKGDSKKKIWITEIGCPGVQRFKEIKDWWRGRNTTEKQQAQWLKSVYTELLKVPRVEKVFWAFLRDCQDHWYNGVDYFGIVRWNFSKKPAFEAYQECVLKWKENFAEGGS